MKQRDDLWRQRRLGQVTASRFHELLSQPRAPAGHWDIKGERGCWSVMHGDVVVAGAFTRKADAEEHRAELLAEWRAAHWSGTALAYLHEKLSELIHCVPADKWRSDPTDWGSENEPNAFAAAIPVIAEEFDRTLSLPVDDFAFIEHPTEPNIGCSPDGIIGDDGLLEIKCPYNGAKWIAAKRESMSPGGYQMPREHIPQVQGSLWVTGRKWYVFAYYDPRVVSSGLNPLLLTRIERDDEYIDTVLAPKVVQFRNYLKSEYEALIRPTLPF